MASGNTVNLEMDLAEEDLATGRSSTVDTMFDMTIGHIEDLIMEDEFQAMQNEFFEKYCQEFEDTEENKFSYTDIHREYTQLVEKFITEQLSSRMPGFSMYEFQKQLVSRKQELEGEVFEMLLTFSDFVAFKDMMLDYRAEKEGRSIDLTSGLTVTSLGSPSVFASGGLEVHGTAIRFGQSNGVLPSQSLGEPTEAGHRLGCGEPMMEGGDTPSSSMEISHGGSSLAACASSSHQGATPLLDKVDMDDAAVDSHEVDQ